MSISLYCGCGLELWDYSERISGICVRCQKKLTANYSYSSAPAAVQADDDDDSSSIETEGETDPVTQRLMDDALKTKGHKECPKCWHPGVFIRMALVCPKHGVFGGA